MGAPPFGPGWVHEIKHDGYRGQAHLQDGRATMFTRAGNDWTQQFAPLPDAIAKLKARDAILDGEVVAVGADGVSDFHALRRQLGMASPQLRYQVFDLLWLDGEDLRPLPLAQRKARLKRPSWSRLLRGQGHRPHRRSPARPRRRRGHPDLCRHGRERDWQRGCRARATLAAAGHHLEARAIGAAGQARRAMDDAHRVGRGRLPEQDRHRQGPHPNFRGPRDDLLL